MSHAMYVTFSRKAVLNSQLFIKSISLIIMHFIAIISLPLKDFIFCMSQLTHPPPEIERPWGTHHFMQNK